MRQCFGSSNSNSSGAGFGKIIACHIHHWVNQPTIFIIDINVRKLHTSFHVTCRSFDTWNERPFYYLFMKTVPSTWAKEKGKRQIQTHAHTKEKFNRRIEVSNSRLACFWDICIIYLYLVLSLEQFTHTLSLSLSFFVHRLNVSRYRKMRAKNFRLFVESFGMYTSIPLNGYVWMSVHQKQTHNGNSTMANHFSRNSPYELHRYTVKYRKFCKLTRKEWYELNIDKNRLSRC